jgi:hypothetical protein
MDEEGRSRDRAGRRPKRFVTPMQKYDIYLQVIRGEVTMAEAAAAAEVDRDDGGPDPAGRRGRVGRCGSARRRPARLSR